MKKLFSLFLFSFLIVNFLGCNNSFDPHRLNTSQSANAKLTVTVTGIGNGKVTSNQGGIRCVKGGGSCTTMVRPKSTITLMAEPEEGYIFLGWYGGVCQGGGADCQVTMDQAKEIKAAFGMVAYISNSEPSPYVITTQNNSFQDSEINKVFNIWIAKTDGTVLYPLTQLTKANSQFPRWSPDGTQIVYQSSRVLDGSDNDNGHYNIWVVNADGSGNKPLTQLTKADSYLPQWSPDGTQIIYGSFRALNETDHSNPVSNIWVTNADGSGNKPLTQLTQAGSYEPQWSPDGTQVLYESSRALDGSDNNNGHYNIWVVNADGSQTKPLTQLTQADSYLPQWSPDGTQVAYQSFRAMNGTDGKNNFSNIWIMNADGSKTRSLTQLTKAGGYYSQWSPDGTQILYESSRALDGSDNNNGHYNIWVVNADGSQTKPLTQLTQADSYLPQRSGDGTQLIYGSSQALDGSDNENGFSNIWVMNLEKSEIKPLTQSKNSHSFLQLIPD